MLSAPQKFMSKRKHALNAETNSVPRGASGPDLTGALTFDPPGGPRAHGSSRLGGSGVERVAGILWQPIATYGRVVAASVDRLLCAVMVALAERL